MRDILIIPRVVHGIHTTNKRWRRGCIADIIPRGWFSSYDSHIIRTIFFVLILHQKCKTLRLQIPHAYLAVKIHLKHIHFEWISKRHSILLQEKKDFLDFISKMHLSIYLPPTSYIGIVPNSLLHSHMHMCFMRQV